MTATTWYTLGRWDNGDNSHQLWKVEYTTTRIIYTLGRRDDGDNSHPLCWVYETKTLTRYTMGIWDSGNNSQLLFHWYMSWQLSPTVPWVDYMTSDFQGPPPAQLDQWYSWRFWDQSSSSTSILHGTWEGRIR